MKRAHNHARRIGMEPKLMLDEFNHQGAILVANVRIPQRAN
jgi:hypothetical protein